MTVLDHLRGMHPICLPLNSIAFCDFCARRRRLKRVLCRALPALLAPRRAMTPLGNIERDPLRPRLRVVNHFNAVTLSRGLGAFSHPYFSSFSWPHIRQQTFDCSATMSFYSLSVGNWTHFAPSLLITPTPS
jgi:hypothetical protein